jgi:hypothetical protein
VKWMDFHTGLYNNPGENTGRKRTFRDVLMSDFAMDHETCNCYKKLKNDTWFANDLETIISLRTCKITDEEKLMLKSTLQCWQPSCFMINKSKGLKPYVFNPIMQLDFDHLEEWDIESLKQSIFDLPFVCLVSLSCSGTGIYALLLIAEPERLKDYAQYCFRMFEYYGIPIDKGKGQTHTQLRFVSYDANMLIRDDPETLKIKRFNTPKIISKPTVQYTASSSRVNWAVKSIQDAQIGSRWPTVQKVAYTMGGLNTGLGEIIKTIKESPQYTGVESKYLQCANDCFKDGQLKPITT